MNSKLFLLNFLVILLQSDGYSKNLHSQILFSICIFNSIKSLLTVFLFFSFYMFYIFNHFVLHFQISSLKFTLILFFFMLNQTLEFIQILTLCQNLINKCFIFVTLILAQIPYILCTVCICWHTLEIIISSSSLSLLLIIIWSTHK